MVVLVAAERLEGLEVLVHQGRVLRGVEVLVVAVILAVVVVAHPQLVEQEAELLLEMGVLVLHQAFLAQA